MRTYRVAVETVRRDYYLVESEYDLRQAPHDCIFEYNEFREDGYAVISEKIVDVDDVEWEEECQCGMGPREGHYGTPEHEYWLMQQEGNEP